MKRITTLIALVLFATPSTALADDDDKKVFELLEKSDVDLATAVELAEAHAGGYAFEVELDDDAFTPEFEVHVVTDGAVREVRVGLDREVKSRSDDESVPEKRKMSLAAVIRMAESSADGRAHEAECDDDRFARTCEVSLVTANGAELEVVIDTDKGKVVRTRKDD